MQSASLFPLQFLLVFANGLFYFHLALEIIAGLATYYFLKRLKCHPWACVVGASAFAVNGTFAWITHTIFNPIAFLPMLLLGVEIILDRVQNKQARGWFTLAIAVAATVYAGFPETGYINALFVGLWALVRMTTLDRSLYKAYILRLLMGCAVGIGLSAPLLVAFFGYLPHANVGLHAANTVHLVLPISGLSGLILPYIYGPIFGFWGYDKTLTLYSWWAVVGGFVALSTVIVGMVGLLNKAFRRTDRIYLIAWTAFCILASYGLLGANYIAGHFPGLSRAAFSRYLPPTYEMAIIILMAMGLSWAFNKLDKKYVRAVLIAGGTSLVMVLAATLGAIPQYHRLLDAPNKRAWFIFGALWGLVMVGLLSLLMIMAKRRWARALLVVVILIDVAVMYIVPITAAPREAHIDHKPVTFLKANLGNQRFFSLGPIQPNYGTFFRIASSNINDIPQPETYSEYIVKKLDTNTSPITFTGTNSLDGKAITPVESFILNHKNQEAIGVKYLITFPKLLTPAQIKEAGLKKVFTSEISEIYELPNPKPYITDTKNACKVLGTDRDFFSVNCKEATTLVRLEQYMPGWGATVSGQATPVTAKDNLVQQIKVPAGEHKVKFVYEPPHIRWSYVLALASLAAIGYCYRDPIRNQSIKTYKRIKAIW